MDCKKFLGAASAALLIVIAILTLAPGAWAQSHYKSLYTFTGGNDGSQPYAGVILDRAGNLYGTTMFGGSGSCGLGCGTVFKLTPNVNGRWTETVLHSFVGTDGGFPHAGLIFDPAGNLYGTTYLYGNSVGGGLGNVFKLAPQADGSWTESVLHVFNGGSDGMFPYASLIFDQAGNLYGTTIYGGSGLCDQGCGTVFKLMPSADGSWAESVLYNFVGGAQDGYYPEAGLTFDGAGNLYGTTTFGGPYGWGTVFKLTPNTDGSWTESVLYFFTFGGGGVSYAGLIFDATGNLYGTTENGGDTTCLNAGCGAIFKLAQNSKGVWNEMTLHQFTGGKDGGQSSGGLLLDQAGNLYGTTSEGGNVNYCGGTGCGVVFKLAPNSKGRWNEMVLQPFVDRPGAHPNSGLIFDAAGNLYGTTGGDGATTFGSVFEITP
jgi:uncharacterized repeat protein (TIGR03803 family)